MAKQFEKLCGCHVATVETPVICSSPPRTVKEKQIVFCRLHARAVDAAKLLNMFRDYFADGARAEGKEPESMPFVQAIDAWRGK